MKSKELVKKADEKTNPEFNRDNVKSRDLWIKKVVKELGVEVENIKVNNPRMPAEPVLVYRNKRLVWCAPRSKMLWSNYLFDSNGKVISKVYTNDDANRDFEWLKKRIKEIDDKTVKEPKVKSSKSEEKKSTSVVKILEEAEQRTKANHGNGFSLKSNHIRVTPEVALWCQEKGYKLSTNTIYIA